MGEDLTPDVTALSTKLIEAIDAQSSLEDRIQAMRRELESLRKTNTDLTTKLSTAVEKPVYDAEVKRRQQSETKNTQLQSEIDELTGSLFNEANKMVADAKKDTAVWAKRNSQLQLQLKEKDTLLDNMQQQLTGLKAVLQDMTEEEQANEKLRAAADDSQSQRSGAENQEEDQLTSIAAETEYSLSAPVRPLVRLDLQNFSEFKSIAQNFNLVSSVHQNLYGHGPKKSISSENIMSPKVTNNSTNNSLSPATTGNSLEKTTSGESPISTPRLHLNFTGVNSPAYQPPSLKDFKFFKRALADDIDPTLRLENSPHISWYARRSILSSIIEGTAVVEPISGVNEGYKFNGGQLTSSTNSGDGHLYAYPQGGPPVATRQPCKFCGETRNSSLLYARMHNLRIDKSKEPTTPGHSASNSASGTAASALGVAINFNKSNKEETPTGYALCFYCLNRVRSVCDFAQFMRSIRDGVWKIEDGDIASQYKAWDECVRLRERMFWARIGGSFAGHDRERVSARNLENHLHKKFVHDLQSESSEPRSSMDGGLEDNAVEEDREAEEEAEAEAHDHAQEGDSSHNDMEFKESREYPETPELQKSESPAIQQEEYTNPTVTTEKTTTEKTTNDEQESVDAPPPPHHLDIPASKDDDDTTGEFEDSVEYQSLPHE